MENILCTEPISNSKENSNNEEGSYNGIEHGIDKFRYFNAAGDGDNI